MTEKISRVIIRRRFFIVLAIVAATVVLGLGFRKFEVRNNLTEWLPDGDHIATLFNRIGEDFSSTKLLLVLVAPDGGDVFDEDVLRRVKKFSDAMKEEKRVSSVISLSNISNIRKMEGGIEVNDLIPEVPETPEEMAALREYALSREEFIDTVVSDDARYTGIMINVRDDADEVKFTGEVVVPAADGEFGPVGKVFVGGLPSDAFWSNKYATNDMKRLTPVVVALMAVILWLVFRNPVSVALPIVSVLIAVVWAMGFMLGVGRPVNVVTSALPILLVSIGVAYGIHVVNAFYLARRDGALTPDKAEKALAGVFVPVLLSGLTTFVGFLSFTTARLKLMTWFGTYAAVGVVFAMLVALTFLPAVLSAIRLNGKKNPVSGPAKADIAKPGRRDVFDRFLENTGQAVRRYPAFTVLISVTIAAAMLAGVPRVEREVNFVKYFPVTSKPRVASETIRDKFGGAYTFNIYAESGEAKDPAVLKQLQRAENFAYTISGTTKSTSVADYIAELNWNMNDVYAIPDTAGAVANLWLFIEGRDMMKQMVAGEENRFLSTGKVQKHSTKFMHKVTAPLDEYFETEAPRELVEIEAGSLPDSGRTELRNYLARDAAKQIFWILHKYTDAPPADYSGISKIIEAETARPVASDDPAFSGRMESVARDYIFGNGFELLVDEGLGEKIYGAVMETIKDGPADYSTFYTAVGALLPPQQLEEEEWAVESIAETFNTRVRSTRLAVFADRAWSALAAVLPADAAADSHFEKRTRGIIYSIADSYAVMDKKDAAALGLLDNSVYRDVTFSMEHNGTPALVIRLDRYLFSSLLQSMGIAIVVVFVMMLIQFRSLRLGLIAITPIWLSVCVVFGLMGFGGVSLDYGTMIIPPIAIGIGIDYTIHYIHKYRKERALLGNAPDAVTATSISTGRAIISNAAAVAAGFLVMLLSDMYVLRAFGWITAITMGISAFGSMTLVPALILITRKKYGGSDYHEKETFTVDDGGNYVSIGGADEGGDGR